MKAVLTGLLWLDENDVQPYLHKIIQSYTHVNPKDESTFSTYLIKNGKIGVPYGNRDKIHSIIPNIDIVDKRIYVPFDVPKHSILKLRDYQEDAMRDIEVLLNKGITEFNLSGKTGSGKSFMLSNIVAKLGCKTLIIADKKMLINQLTKEIEHTLGCKATVLNKKNTVLGDINVATSQFIAKNPNVWYQIKEQISLLVLDEAEVLASPTVTKIFQRSPAKYKIYISATFSRSVDERTSALIDFAGNNKIILHSTGNVVPTVIAVECPEIFTPPMDKASFALAKGRFFKLNSIFDKIDSIAKYSISKNRQLLIGCDISSMQNTIKERLESLGISTAILSSSTKENDRLTILEKYDKSEIQCLVGFGVLNAGLSIPKISTVIRVSTPSSPEKLEQFIGRGVRYFEGKEGCFVIDLVFKGFNTKARRSLYELKRRTEGWKIYYTTWDKFRKQIGV